MLIVSFSDFPTVGCPDTKKPPPNGEAFPVFCSFHQTAKCPGAESSACPLLPPKSGNQHPIAETVEKTLSISDSMSMSDNAAAQGSYVRSTRISSGVQLNIDVTVQCTPADLETLGQKLRKVLKDFNEPDPKAESPAQPPPTPPAPANEVAEE